MKKEDIEFWNGISKGIALSIERLKELEDPVTVNDCIALLREQKEQVARIHVLDVKDFLRSHLQ